MQVSMQKITYLTSLYMRIIEKLNGLQDQREHYFTFKMQKLMSEPYIIRFFNNQGDCKKNNLDDRRKKLQQTIQKEAEKQNHRTVIEETLRVQEEKQQKMMKKIKEFIDESEKSIQLRIKKRNQMRESKNGVGSQSRVILQSEVGKIGERTIEKTWETEMVTNRQQLMINNSPVLSEEYRQSEREQGFDKLSRMVLSDQKPKLPNKKE